METLFIYFIILIAFILITKLIGYEISMGILKIIEFIKKKCKGV